MPNGMIQGPRKLCLHKEVLVALVFNDEVLEACDNGSINLFGFFGSLQVVCRRRVIDA